MLSLALQDTIEPPAVCRDGAPAPAPLTIFGNWIVDPLTGATDLNPRMTTHSIFDQRLIERGEPPVFALNCFNVDAQADRLLSRAVGYSAALLRYFFRGRLGMEVSNVGVRIANWTPGETMAGTFELYHDAADGTRRRLTSWTLQLPPEQYSQHLSTPRLPQPTRAPRVSSCSAGRWARRRTPWPASSGRAGWSSTTARRRIREGPQTSPRWSNSRTGGASTGTRLATSAARS